MDNRLLQADSLDASPALRTAVARLLAAGKAGVFFDFDGTLSPLQDDPESVLPAPGVAAEMERLTSRVARVAVVSGRNAEFIRDRLGTSSDIEIYGLYGLEHLGTDGQVRVNSEVAQWIPVIRSLRDSARRELPAGVYVEDKHVTVALHYRTALDARDAVQDWAAASAERTGVRLQPGRMVVELRPPVARDKGDVLTDLVAGLDVAWYFGDDVSDIPAFAALDRAPAATVRLGVANDTQVDELIEHVDFLLASPLVVAHLLALLNAGQPG